MAIVPTAKDQNLRKRRPLRWILVLAASVLLHLLAFHWAGSRIGLPEWREPASHVMVTELRTAAPPSEPVAAPPPAAAAPKPKPKRKPRKRTPPPPVAKAKDAAPPPAGLEAPGTSVEPPAEIAAADPPATGPADYPAEAVAQDLADAVAAATEEAAKLDEQARYRVDPPPSVELKYDVRALRSGQPTYGSGKIRWQSDGTRYTITGEASVLFFTVLDFRSEGMLDEFGVSPVIYSEKRFRRSQTNTHFHRERNTISFSASTTTYPRIGGEQDRASVIWQLASIGRGDGGRFAPDAEIDLFVAGVRDAETWRLRVIGEEDIEIDSRKLSAWHVVRLPRAGSYDQKLDIWLAPEQQWYPVKLRFTEVNGDYLELSLSNMNILTAGPSASDQ